MLISNTNTAKIFTWNNTFSKATYTSGVSAVSLKKGTVLGRITATGKVVPFTSAATDGSQNPMGVLADDYEVAPSTTIEVTYCDGGKVNEGLLILDGSDTLNTAVGTLGIVRDLIQRNTHIKLQAVTENTYLDNQ